MMWRRPKYKCKRCGKRHDRWTEICRSCEHEIASFVLEMAGTILALRIRGDKEEDYQDVVDVVGAELRSLRVGGAHRVRVDGLEQAFLMALHVPLDGEKLEAQASHLEETVADLQESESRCRASYADLLKTMRGVRKMIHRGMYAAAARLVEPYVAWDEDVFTEDDNPWN